MNEIAIYYNQEKTKQVSNPITFDAVEAGEVTKKSLFFSNEIDFPINLLINLTGEDVNITKNIKSLLPTETKEVVFEFTPKTTVMKPISANLKIEMDYIVK
jgi:hypothetical protein